MSKKHDRVISIKWSKEDSGFIATVSDVSGLSGWGATEEEALHEFLVAREAMSQTIKDMGRDALVQGCVDNMVNEINNMAEQFTPDYKLKFINKLLQTIAVARAIGKYGSEGKGVK